MHCTHCGSEEVEYVLFQRDSEHLFCQGCAFRLFGEGGAVKIARFKRELLELFADAQHVGKRKEDVLSMHGFHADVDANSTDKYRGLSEAEYFRLRRAEHRRKGMCTECREPREKGRSVCWRHRQERLQRTAKLQEVKP